MSMGLRVLGANVLPAYVATVSFAAASASFSTGAQALSVAALAISLAPLGWGALTYVLAACFLALIGIITRLVAGDVRGYASKGLAVSNVALMVGVPAMIAPALASRPLSVAEPLALVMVSSIASYALGLSYAVGRGLHACVIPVSLKWLRGLSRRMFDKFFGFLTWFILTALIARAMIMVGAPPTLSAVAAAPSSLLAVLVARRNRVGRIVLLASCALASIALLKEGDVANLGNALRFLEEVVKYLGW